MASACPSVRPCHGRCVRPAETSTHSSVNGSWRRCGPLGSDTLLGPGGRPGRRQGWPVAVPTLRDDELAGLRPEDVPRLRAEALVADHDIRAVEPRDRADAGRAPLRVVGGDDET